MSSMNISTLLVLVAESGYDFQDLVNTTGAVNDPFGDKDKWNLPKVIQNGTFKSHLLDQFPSLNADMVSISACNKNGEKLWTTHFNTTGQSLTFLDSLRGNNIIGSSAAINGTYKQNVILSYNKYSTVVYPGEVLTDLAWFAVTNGNLIDDPHPMIFYARETSVPFPLPQITEGI
ncbi:hypothetical protein CHS0354_040804 [Potamilus streckersoni]|uniref:Uncharacterized protein n=1 Tax=Potamilus streckersoni TaxID=2493646 RepID=A0AAE0SLF5_9BIVA|nr:hypothetical protein CHS0354_040804 [Potamilus streckersoni]